MADATYGETSSAVVGNGYTALGPTDIGKLAKIDLNLQHWEDIACETWELDMAGGARTLTDDEAFAAAIDFTGTLGANRVADFNNTIEKSWWVRDSTTDGYTLTFQPTGETGVVIPKGRWVQVRHDATNVTFMSGWDTGSETPAVTYNTNWADTSGRGLVVHKEDGVPTQIGGRVFLEGAIEKGTAAITMDETMITLPQYYRPGYDVSFRVPVNSDITTGYAPRGIVKYGFGWLNPAIAHTTPQGLSGVGIEDFSADTTNLGHVVMRGGWITAFPSRLQVVTETAAGTFNIRLLVNGTAVITNAYTSSGTGYYEVNTAQNPGIDAVAAGDILTTDITFGTFQGTIQTIMCPAYVTTDGPVLSTIVNISTAGVMKIRGPLPEIDETIALDGISFFAEN